MFFCQSFGCCGSNFDRTGQFSGVLISSLGHFGPPCIGLLLGGLWVWSRPAENQHSSDR